MPHLADDDYVRRFAEMVRERLDPGLRVYVEHSNEVWNRQFEQARYAVEQGRKLGLSDNAYQAQLFYHSQRSVEILGLNSARLYGIKTVETGDYKAVPKDYEARMTDELKTVLEFGQLRADNLARMRETYLALAIEPEDIRYGWTRATS